MAFALLGALVFSILIAPVVSSYLFRKGATEWRNPVLHFLERVYRRSLLWSIHHRLITVGAAAVAVGGTLYLASSGAIGSEFLPHLDEGAIWARGTLSSSIGPTESARVTREARRIFASFPEVTQVVSQLGRPDDGTDATGFFNTEYFIDLKPREQWRPRFRSKDDLIEEMTRAAEKIPGALWNFSQPIADNMEEAVSGVKGQLAVKLYGTDLKTLEATADRIGEVMGKIPGVADLAVFRVVGQPNLDLEVDRAKTDRFGINVADVQDAIETAVGGKAVSQVLQGERRFDLVVRYQEPYRRTAEDIANIRILAPTGERVAVGPVVQHTGARRRLDDLPRGGLPLHRHQVQRAGTRPRIDRRAGHSRGQPEREASGRITGWSGPVNMKARNARRRALRWWYRSRSWRSSSSCIASSTLSNGRC